MHKEVHIRPGHPTDAPRLAVLAAQVWLHTYCTDGINDEVAQYVLAEFTPGKFAQALSEPGKHVIVAENGDSLVGFAVVKQGVACPTEGVASTVELQTLYVQAHFIGHGVGQALIAAAEAQAQSALWLTVNARNDRAIGFYTRLGYAKVGTTYFVLGEGRYENHVMVGRGA